MPTETAGAGERPMILLAEDDALTARLIVHRLEREGLVVAHYPDGQAALEAAQDPDNKPYSLAILDVKMPRMDGFELLGRLKEDPRLEDIPVVMLTAKDSLMDKLKGKMSGSDEYLTKPFTPEQLMEKVRKHLK